MKHEVCLLGAVCLEGDYNIYVCVYMCACVYIYIYIYIYEIIILFLNV